MRKATGRVLSVYGDHYSSQYLAGKILCVLWDWVRALEWAAMACDEKLSWVIAWILVAWRTPYPVECRPVLERAPEGLGAS